MAPTPSDAMRSFRPPFRMPAMVALIGLQGERPRLKLLLELRHVRAAEHADERLVPGRIAGGGCQESIVEAVQEAVLLQVQEEVARLGIAGARGVKALVAVGGHGGERRQLAGADGALETGEAPVRHPPELAVLLPDGLVK